MARLGSFDVQAYGPTSFDITNDPGGWFDRDWIPGASSSPVSGWTAPAPDGGLPRRRRWKTAAERERERDELERLEALARGAPGAPETLSALEVASEAVRTPYVFLEPVGAMPDALDMALSMAERSLYLQRDALEALKRLKH